MSQMKCPYCKGELLKNRDMSKGILCSECGWSSSGHRHHEAVEIVADHQVFEFESSDYIPMEPEPAGPQCASCHAPMFERGPLERFSYPMHKTALCLLLGGVGLNMGLYYEKLELAIIWAVVVLLFIAFQYLRKGEGRCTRCGAWWQSVFRWVKPDGSTHWVKIAR